jgi:hypothetical protein
MVITSARLHVKMVTTSVILCLILALAAATPRLAVTVAKLPVKPTLLVLGDDYSDPGNLMQMTDGLLPAPGESCARYSISNTSRQWIDLLLGNLKRLVFLSIGHLNLALRAAVISKPRHLNLSLCSDKC